MDNPYAASDLSAEPILESRKRQPAWKSLLIAYAIHHLCLAVGLIVSAIIDERGQIAALVPQDKPFDLAKMLLFAPIIDIYFLVEPFAMGRGFVPATYGAFRWLRCGFVLLILVGGVANPFLRWRYLLLYIGIISFLVGVTTFTTPIRLPD